MQYQIEIDFLSFEQDVSTCKVVDEEPWTDDELYNLRIYLLKKSLSLFSDGRANIKARTDALYWMQSPSKHPFSFYTCCHVAGADPEETKDLVVDIFKRDYRRKGTCSLDIFLAELPDIVGEYCYLF